MQGTCDYQNKLQKQKQSRTHKSQIRILLQSYSDPDLWSWPRDTCIDQLSRIWSLEITYTFMVKNRGFLT